MSAFYEKLFAASRASVDNVPDPTGPSCLRDEVSTLLGETDPVEYDVLEFAEYIAKGILVTQTARLLEVQVENHLPPDLGKAGDTAIAVIYLTGVAAGKKLAEAEARRGQNVAEGERPA